MIPPARNSLRAREPYKQLDIVRLHRGFMRRTVAADVPAPLTAVDYDVTAARVRLNADRAHYAAAACRPVAGVHIDME